MHYGIICPKRNHDLCDEHSLFGHRNVHRSAADRLLLRGLHVPGPQKQRLRSSIYVEAAGTRLLLDSSPDLRQQALRENITDVDAVLYTHAHVDHVGGFDDLRAFCWRRSGGLPHVCFSHDGGRPADHVRLGVRS